MAVLDRDNSAADQMMSRALHGQISGGELQNNLLREFQLGYPLNKLRLLLRSEDENITAAGMWIASELGAGVRPLFADIVDLIHHPALKVRFFSLDCVLVCAGVGDQRAINLGLDLVDDPEPAVRWKAMIFTSAVSDTVLRAALREPVVDESARKRRQVLEILLDSAATHDSAAITARLADSDPLVRRYAAAIAARVAHTDAGPLRQAMQSSDSTIKQFAVDMERRTRAAPVW